MAWLQMTDVGALCALRLRFILDSPIPLSLGYRLLVTGPNFTAETQRYFFSQQGHEDRKDDKRY